MREGFKETYALIEESCKKMQTILPNFNTAKYLEEIQSRKALHHNMLKISNDENKGNSTSGYSFKQEYALNTIDWFKEEQKQVFKMTTSEHNGVKSLAYIDICDLIDISSVKLFKDQIVVDICAGDRDLIYNLCVEHGAKAYIGLEAYHHYGLNESLKSTNKEIPYVVLPGLAQLTLTYFPKDSVSLFSSGFVGDARIIDLEQEQIIEQEARRILSPDGISLSNSSGLVFEEMTVLENYKIENGKRMFDEYNRHRICSKHSKGLECLSSKWNTPIEVVDNF